jgi:type II secretion system protein N
MAEKTLSLWKRVLAYASFSVAALLAALFATFPYDALKTRVRAEAERSGYFLRIGSLGPGLFGVRATGVEVSKQSDAVTEAPPEALLIDSVSITPTLFPPGLSLSAKLLGGAATAAVSPLSGLRVRLDLEELDLAKGNLKGFTGLDVVGELEAHVELRLPRGGSGPAAAEPDLSQATGTVAVALKGVTINGGSLSIPIPQYGPEPTPIDLPKISLGDVSARLKFEKGQGSVEELRGRSSDLEFSGSGTLKLARRLEYAEPTMEVRFKPDADFQKRLGMLGSVLSIVGPDPKDPTWRMGRLSGYLGRPRFP